MSLFKKLAQKFTSPKAKLELRLEKRDFVLGEEVKGAVQLASQEEFYANGITANLSCYESVKKTRIVRDDEKHSEEEEPYWDGAGLHSDDLKVARAGHVSAGLNKRFPFVFRLPKIGRTTFHSVDKNVEWSIKATLAVAGRPGIETKDMEIFVAKLESPPSVMSKEIVREIVLIPCSYCGALMPQTSVFCPNCGARRKA